MDAHEYNDRSRWFSILNAVIDPVSISTKDETVDEKMVEHTFVIDVPVNGLIQKIYTRGPSIYQKFTLFENGENGSERELASIDQDLAHTILQYTTSNQKMEMFRKMIGGDPNPSSSALNETPTEERIYLYPFVVHRQKSWYSPPDDPYPYNDIRNEYRYKSKYENDLTCPYADAAQDSLISWSTLCKKFTARIIFKQPLRVDHHSPPADSQTRLKYELLVAFIIKPTVEEFG